MPACFQLADDVFPRVRAQAARQLVAAGHSQADAAKQVGVSQAMVSKYVRQSMEADALVLRLTDELLDGSTGSDGWCRALAVTHDDEPLRDLLAAERLILDGAPLEVVPQIGLNVARAPANAADPSDVLAYPARLVAAGKRVLRPAPPQPGGSHHLASCLLVLRRGRPELHAMANVRGGSDVAAAADRLGWNPLTFSPDDDVTTRFSDPAAAKTKVFHDPGALGIEPCLYIAGHDARDVARAILRLHDEVRP